MTVNGWGSDEPVAEANGGTATATAATGDIIYASAANTLAKLAAGTNGHVLTVATDVPNWEAASGGSPGWTFLASSTASASASISFDSTYITSTYDMYMIIIANVGLANQTQLLLRVSPDNGSTIRTTGYDGRTFDHKSASTTSVTTYLGINREDWENAAGDRDGISWVQFSKPTSSTDKTAAFVWTGFKANDGNEVGRAMGCYDSDEAHNYIQFTASTGNIANGTFYLYGLNTP